MEIAGGGGGGRGTPLFICKGNGSLAINLLSGTNLLFSREKVSFGATCEWFINNQLISAGKVITRRERDR